MRQVAVAVGAVGLRVLWAVTVNHGQVNQRDKCNEIVAASVLYCKDVRVDGPMSEKEWSTPANMNHFTVVRKLDGSVFPPGWDDAVRTPTLLPL